MLRLAMGNRRNSAALLVTLLAACGKPPPPVVQPTLAVFELQVRELKLKPGVVAALRGHAHRLMQESGVYRVVARDKVKRALRRTRRRRRSDRHCHELRCQAALGRKLRDADRSLPLSLTRNLMGQCDVIGNVYDLHKKGVDINARARSGCAEEELRRSFDLVLCRIIDVQRSGARSAKETQPPRDCLAQAEFLRVDDKLERLLAPARGRRRHAQEWEQRMAEQVLDLKREYDHVVGLGVPRWTVAATCRSGRLYEHFAQRQLEAGARPPASVRRQGKEAVVAYDKERREVGARRAKPFLDKARQLYRKCLSRATKHKMAQDRYTTEARSRLAGLPSSGPR